MQNIQPKTIIQMIRVYAGAHTKTVIAGGVVFLLFGYWIYGKITSTADETRYVTANVEKGTLITSISGTGQVSASNQIDLKLKASGDVLSVNVQNGQTIKAGTLIAVLDPRDAQKAVRDAEANLKSAVLAAEKLQKPADNLSIIQAQNNLARTQESKQQAQNDLAKAYEDGFNTVANAFLDLPNIMTGLQDILFSNTTGLGINGQWNIDFYGDAIAGYSTVASIYKTDARNKYTAARTIYDKNSQNYKSTNRSSDTKTIESLIDETYNATKNIAESIKSANNLIQLYKDVLTSQNLKTSSVADTQLASLNTYTGKTNTHLLNLLTAKNSIQDDKDAIVNTDRTIVESTESLSKLRAGADALDIESAKLTTQQRENALMDVKEKLADYYVRAPFDGTIAKLSIKTSDSLSAGTNIGTFITQKKLAEISLNEVDVAKVKIGEKVTLTFDAVENLSISGEVAEIDTVGTVTQGVVTYSVKISFDTQDDRIKSGMSVSAAIITDAKQDVLTVPNSGVKTQGNTYYVEIFDTPLAPAQGNQGTASSIPPRQQAVEIGLSNDISTEIVSGVKEGIQVVVRTITDTTAQATQQAPSLFGSPGGNRNPTIPRTTTGR